jgi:predicted nucleic acid-binding protein
MVSRAKPSTTAFIARRTECYVDTSALIAIATILCYQPLFRRLFSDPPRLATSALVIAEGHGWCLRRYDQTRALEFLSFIEALAVLSTESFDATALGKSARLTRKFADQKLTLADAHGLVVIAERRITSCWSTDRHPGLTGAFLVV